MRFLLLLLTAALALFAVVAAAQWYLPEPVYVEFMGWSASPPASLALVALLVFLAALSLALRLALFFLFLPGKWAAWREERRLANERRLLQKIMRLAAYRNRRGLLAAFGELSKTQPQAAWSAARVASKMGDTAARDKYLQVAAAAEDQVIAAAAKAAICLHKGRLTEAENILAQAGAPKGEVALAEMHYAICKDRGDWRAALAACARLRDECPQDWQNKTDAAVRLALNGAKTRDELKNLWRESVPAFDKNRAPGLVAYASALARLGDSKGAQDGLATALKQFPQDNDVLEAALALGNVGQHEAAFKANEARADGNDVFALRILARLAESLGLHGKAKEFYQKLNALTPHSEYQKALAALAAKGA